jgi:hypothetical protein
MLYFKQNRGELLNPMRGKLEMRKYLFAIPLIFLMLGCNDSEDSQNFCYLLTASDPCYDANEGGSTEIVTDQTVNEVIAEEEGMPGFEGELEITVILNTIAFVFIDDPAPDCPYEQSELVIKTANDWNRFRNSCLFSFFELPNVDFSENMVLVSTQNFAEFGTTIEAVLEFDSELVVVIEDDVSDIPPSLPGFPFDIVSIPRRDLPVDFIRVEVFFSPFQ